MHSFQLGKNLTELNIKYNSNRIKQFHVVEYLGCCIDINLSDKFMAVKSLKETMMQIEKALINDR